MRKHHHGNYQILELFKLSLLEIAGVRNPWDACLNSEARSDSSGAGNCRTDVDMILNLRFLHATPAFFSRGNRGGLLALQGSSW